MSEGLKRRDFLKVLGTTGAGAAAVGCSTGDVERLIPYVFGDEDAVASVPTWYASTCRECPAGCGIQVETHEGRATKVEGNPNHPVNRGNLCARGQASVQGLYHPDRIAEAMRVETATGRQPVAWTTAERQLVDRIRRAEGEVVFLSGRYTGTMERLADDFVAGIGGRRVVYEPFGNQPRDLDFANADVLVAFGADFLETWGSPVDYAWQFSQMRGRDPEQRATFIWVGAHRPMTGLNADVWIPARPGTEVLIARAFAGNGDIGQVAEAAGVSAEKLGRAIDDFRAGNGIAMGPGASMSGPAARELRQAIGALNGAAVNGQAENEAGSEILQLVDAMRRGQVDVIMVDAADPVHTLPAGVGFEEAFRQVRTRVSFSSYPDDTTRRCTLLLPNHHFLEQWNDYESREGVRSLVQPAMRPVFNTKQTGDVLLNVARQLGIEQLTAGVEAVTYHDYLRAVWAEEQGVDNEAWRTALREGGSFEAAEPVENETEGEQANGVIADPTTAASVADTGEAPTPIDGEASFDLVVYPSHRFYDGRSANRPWLLELPDPVTKVSWHSFVEIHPAAAERLGARQGDLVEIESPHGMIEVPVYIYPGVRRDAVALQMGLGQEDFGRYNQGRGVNANALLGPSIDPETGEFARAGIQVAVRRTRRPRRRDRIFEAGARVQHDRDLVQAISVDELIAANRERPEGVVPGTEVSPYRRQSLRGAAGLAPTEQAVDPAGSFPTPGGQYGEYVAGATRWGMVIDLDRCTGCSACVIACNAENNIPVVGPDEIRKGRELHWIRIERYWGVTRDESEALTDEATDDTRFMPMLCQHCSNAPCEPVCPVYAAYHTPSGLNAQVYNRCVGTRYCANNCPYKVRVFNWFTYEFEQPLNWQLNPDVTVRDKGVMEKCTFCVQRIREVEHRAERDNRAVQDGEVTPACVQTCPSEVFVFGNMSDPESAVARAAASNRSYRVLDYFNTQPGIVYLKKVTQDEPAVTEWTLD